MLFKKSLYVEIYSISGLQNQRFGNISFTYY